MQKRRREILLTWVPLMWLCCVEVEDDMILK
jgi:hypothetical protein